MLYTDIALYHVNTYKAGEAGYYSPRPRGYLEVWHDSKRYLYDMRGTNVKASEARRFVQAAWDSSNGIKVIGKFPRYEVEAR